MKNKYFYLYVSIIPIIIFGISLALLLQSPHMGLDFTEQNNKWYISAIDSESPASRYPELKGKEIVAIGEHQLGKDDLKKEFDDIPTWKDLQDYWEAKKYFAHNIKNGSPITITIKNNDEFQSFSITPVNIPIFHTTLKSWGALIAGFSYLFIGLIVILKKPNYLPARLFFWASLLMGIMLILIGFMHAYEFTYNLLGLQIIYIIYGYTNIFGTLLTLHFFMVFPRDVFNIQNKKFFIISLYTLALLTYVLYIFKIFNPALYIFVILSILLGLYFITKHYFKSNSIEKAQTKWLYAGFGLFLLIDLFTYLLPPFLIGHQIISQETLSLFVAILPITIAFSILQYKLMDINNLVDNTLIYIVTLGFLALMDVGIITLLLNTEFLNISTPAAIIISLWIAALVYIQVRNFVQKQIKRALKREIYDINQLSIQLGKKLFSVNNTKEAFTKTNVILHEALYPKSSNAYFYDGNTYMPLWETKKYNLPLDNESIRNIKEPAPLYKLIDSETLPDDCSGGVIVPVIGANKIIGYFLFQDKQSDRLYDNEDMKLFAILAKQLAMAVEAIQMREELKQKEINDIKEKERISREIHDGIGSRFVDAILLGDVITKDIDNSAKILKHTTELKKTLMEGLTDLRELIWTVEPGQNTLGNLVSYITDKAQYLNNKDNIKATVNASIEDEEITISSSVKLNLVRIIQETITNTIKHASATRVDILIEQKNKYLKIEIVDNGKGFNSLDTHSKGYGMRNIKKRCEDIGAKISIAAEADKGADITITMELP